MARASLLDIKKSPAEQVLAGLKDPSRTVSHDAGIQLMSEAGKFGLSVRDYLTLAIETRGTTLSDLGGYEAALVQLSLPVRDDFKEGIVLQAASETFQTFPGTRALFPPVIDDMLYFTRRIDEVEQLESILAGSRVIDGPELLYVVVNDDGSEYQSFVVAEMGRIPVRTIRTGEQSVRMFKHGSGIKTSYEFSRRARLDVLTPFAARVQRELVLSKMTMATSVLINGDGQANTAAPVVSQSVYNGVVATPAIAGALGYQNILAWLVSRAKAGTPVDTVVGNWDAYFQWIRLFAPVTQAGGFYSSAQGAAQMGVTFEMPASPVLAPGNIKFAISAAMPTGKLLGMSKSETLEELKEAQGETAEELREMLNQTITYLRTETSGFRLIWKDTRSVYDYSS